MTDLDIPLAPEAAGTLVQQLVSPAFTLPPPRLDNQEVIPPDVRAACDAAWNHGPYAPRPVTFRLFRDVIVAAEGLAFTADLRLIAGTERGYRPEEIVAVRELVASAGAQRPLPLVEGTCLLCVKRGVEKYGRWLLEMFPGAVLGWENLGFPDLRFIVPRLPGQLGAVIADGLRLLGIEGETAVPLDGAPTRVARLVVIDGLTAHGGYMSPLAVAAVRRAVADIAPGADRALYLPRLATGHRLFRDEAAIVARAREAGFRAFDPGAASFAEQVAAFAGAQRIAGVMGAALTNIVFAPPGAEVTVFAPANMADTSFWFIAGQCGLRYREVRCALAGPSSGEMPWDGPLAFPDAAADLFPPLPGRGKPLDLSELAACFESLGANCEFGLVQRAAGVEQIGFFRFNYAPLDALLRALDCDFADLGDPEQIEIYTEPPPNRELMVRIRGYGFRYHTFRSSDDVSIAEMHAHQVRAVAFLIRKLREDLQTGEKIFVRKGDDSIDIEQILKLFAALRRYGPATLLWVVAGDSARLPGTVEVVRPGLLKGYLDRYAPISDPDAISDAWLDVCQAAHALWRDNAPPGTIARGGAVAALRSVAGPAASLAALLQQRRAAQVRPPQDPPATRRYFRASLDALPSHVATLPDGRARAEPQPLLPAVAIDLPPFALAAWATVPTDSQDAVCQEAKGFRMARPAVSAWLLRNALVQGTFGMLSLDDVVLRETLSHVPLHRLPGAVAEDDDWLRLPEGPVVANLPAAYHLLACNQDNYYHWMIDALSRFDPGWFARVGSTPDAPGAPVLLVPKLDVFWKWESLGALVPDTVPRIALTESGHVLVQRLLFVPDLAGGGFTPHPALLALFDRIAATFGHDPAVRPWRRIYVARTDSRNRVLANEAEVMARAERAGFTPVELSRLSVAEQVRLFVEASHILAPHGAGLVNIGFCRPGAKLCELHMDGYVNWVFRRLAALRRLDYGCLVGERLGAPAGSPHASTWRIDPDSLDAVLRDPGFVA